MLVLVAVDILQVNNRLAVLRPEVLANAALLIGGDHLVVLLADGFDPDLENIVRVRRSRLASAQNPLPRMYSYFGDTTLVLSGVSAKLAIQLLLYWRPGPRFLRLPSPGRLRYPGFGWRHHTHRSGAGQQQRWTNLRQRRCHPELHDESGPFPIRYWLAGPGWFEDHAR